jgi:hypothetical protein
LAYDVLGVVVFHVKVHARGTTGSQRSGDWGRILGKGGDSKKNDSESSSHNSPSDSQIPVSQAGLPRRKENGKRISIAC